jgi:hypothetical protein
MAQDYGHFADGSSAAFGRDLVFAGRLDTATKATQEKWRRIFAAGAPPF